MIPEHINPMQWHQAVGIARQSCARFFRDGATAKDAMRAFGADAGAADVADWGKAVEAIAQVLCARPEKRAA
jgi:predicted site-specific integrase-resolvase